MTIDPNHLEENQDCCLFERGRSRDLADLTQQAAFARLKVAAGLADHARFVSRAEVAELADARGSGPRTRKGVGVRVPSSAPIHQNKELE